MVPICNTSIQDTEEGRLMLDQPGLHSGLDDGFSWATAVREEMSKLSIGRILQVCACAGGALCMYVQGVHVCMYVCLSIRLSKLFNLTELRATFPLMVPPLCPASPWLLFLPKEGDFERP